MKDWKFAIAAVCIFAFGAALGWHTEPDDGLKARVNRLEERLEALQSLTQNLVGKEKP